MQRIDKTAYLQCTLSPKGIAEFLFTTLRIIDHKTYIDHINQFHKIYHKNLISQNLIKTAKLYKESVQLHQSHLIINNPNTYLNGIKDIKKGVTQYKNAFQSRLTNTLNSINDTINDWATFKYSNQNHPEEKAQQFQHIESRIARETKQSNLYNMYDQDLRNYFKDICQSKFYIFKSNNSLSKKITHIQKIIGSKDKTDKFGYFTAAQLYSCQNNKTQILKLLYQKFKLTVNQLTYKILLSLFIEERINQGYYLGNPDQVYKQQMEMLMIKQKKTIQKHLFSFNSLIAHELTPYETQLLHLINKILKTLFNYFNWNFQQIQIRFYTINQSIQVTKIFRSNIAKILPFSFKPPKSTKKILGLNDEDIEQIEQEI